MLSFDNVIGVDEVGRGCLFGEVVACAVKIHNSNHEVFELINDSKKLSEKKRDKIYEMLINSNCISYAIGEASEKEIDEYNILNATFLAMNRALESLNISGVKVLVDGNKLIKGYDKEQEYLIKGDTKSLEIATASILAKVYRDRKMLDYSKIYNKYDLDKHKGYPTKKHYEAIEKYGILDKHRKSFLKKYEK